MLRRSQRRRCHGPEVTRRAGTLAWQWKRCVYRGLVLLAATSDAPPDPPWLCAGDAVDRTMAMKRRKAGTDGTPLCKEAKKGVWAKSMPHLAEFLTATRYEDGEPRQLGRITMGVWGQMWQITLRDPDSREMIRLEVETPDQLLVAAEAVLAADEQPWVWDPHSKPVPTKKRKGGS